ncbi:hypothetical protein LCGC14_1566220 [marine sediment metagenome]|uniref:Uncharacterized protein n=1 Tax=marine sediment metagenome TaxID=412755 RepID=A0A0F9J775_9ZZZZ
MKKLLIFLGVMLLAAGSYAGIIYDNTTDDISSSSGTMTIDGSPVGGGTHPVNLASDVTGELPHASTSNDSSNVHGLDGGANVLGNLDAAAEFVQRATNVSVVVDTAHVPSRIGADAVTFGTAFNAVPIVVVGPSDNTSILAQGGHTVSTTGFTATGFRDSDLTAELSWIALGT